MSSLLGHCHGENWKSPTRSLGRSGKAKGTFEEREKSAFCLRTLHLWLSKSISVCLCLARSSTPLIFVHVVVNGIRCKEREDVHVGIFDA